MSKIHIQLTNYLREHFVLLNVLHFLCHSKYYCLVKKHATRDHLIDTMNKQLGQLQTTTNEVLQVRLLVNRCQMLRIP